MCGYTKAKKHVILSISRNFCPCNSDAILHLNGCDIKGSTIMFYEVTNPFVDLKAESNPQFFSKDVTCIDPSAKPVRHVEQLIEELQSTLTTGDLCSAGKVNT